MHSLAPKESNHLVLRPAHREDLLEKFEHAFWTGDVDVNGLAGRESLLLEVRNAATAGDLDGARRLMADLPEAELDEPAISSTKVWIELLRNPNGSAHQLELLRQAARAEVAPSSYVQTLLTRALAITGHAEEASMRLKAHETSWPSDPEVVLARAAVLQAEGRFRDALEELRSLRRRFPKTTFTTLTQEMILASKLRDVRAFREAYQERRRLEGKGPLPGVSFVWANLNLIVLALLIIWAGALLFHEPIAESIALVCLLGYVPLHWHVLNNRRLLRGFSLITLVLLITSLAVALRYPRP